jgi:hypothetical protein
MFVSSHAEFVARALGDAERERTSYRTRCPVHGGRSLVLSEKNGRLLWCCHAGCSQGEVVQALEDLGLYERQRSTWRPTIYQSFRSF